jgi:hypothetical protein
MRVSPSTWTRRIDSIAFRARSLSSLRDLVALPPGRDISESQWRFIGAQLQRARSRLISSLDRGVRRYLPRVADPVTAARLNAHLGNVELEMASAFSFFDTYMDVLTQRHSPELGPVLAGCDVLAEDALRKDHPALVAAKPPLVYCDRGFGASILREGVRLPDGTPNPMPLVQIPYSRLKEKCNLTSILHEAGHQAMVRLGLDTVLPKAIRQALRRRGASEAVQDLFALWSSEIGPDFWGFCNCGVAQVATMREIFGLPRGHVFRVSWVDPHPPAYLRTRLGFHWCRKLWGPGEWDGWEEEWRGLYPLQHAPDESRELMSAAVRHIPTVGSVLFNARFRALRGGSIPDLFALRALNPRRLTRLAAGAQHLESATTRQLSPCAQLAVYRLIRNRGQLSEQEIDGLMTKWLLRLGRRR